MMNSHLKWFSLAGFVVLLSASWSFADPIFYQCENRDGGVHFTDRRPGEDEICFVLGSRENRRTVDGKVRKYFMDNPGSLRAPSDNRIGNGEKALRSFNGKLKTLSEPLTIYFVGDSHLHSGDFIRGFVDGLSYEHSVEQSILCVHKTGTAGTGKKGRRHRPARVPKDFPSGVPRICTPLDGVDSTGAQSAPKGSKRSSPGHGPVSVYAYGISGKTFEYFSGSALFERDLRARRPDLVVAMLGTNDAFARPQQETVRRDIMSFLERVRRASPSSDILFITPPDSYFKDGHDNSYIPLVGRELRATAREQGIAFWDLYKMMGGEGAMQQWLDKGLSQKDRIHFLADGYVILGRLFSQALMLTGKTAEP